MYTGSYCVLNLSRTLFDNNTGMDSGVILSTYGLASIDECIFRNISNPIVALMYRQNINITNSLVRGSIFTDPFVQIQFLATNTSFHNSSIQLPNHFVSQQSTYWSSNLLFSSVLSGALITDSVITDSVIAILYMYSLTVSHSVINNTLINVLACEQIFFSNSQLYTTQVSHFSFLILLLEIDY